MTIEELQAENDTLRALRDELFDHLQRQAEDFSRIITYKDEQLERYMTMIINARPASQIVMDVSNLTDEQISNLRTAMGKRDK